MGNHSSNPLSFKNILAGIIVTVIGGVILSFIIRDAIFSSPGEPPATQPPAELTQPGVQVIEPIVTPSPTEKIACLRAPQKRLSLGANAVVCTASETISLRSGPRRSASAIDHLSTGTRLVVIGEAICDEASQWWYWEVKTDRGFTGWVSEGGDEVDPYFVCPGN